LPDFIFSSSRSCLFRKRITEIVLNQRLFHIDLSGEDRKRE
jgi:hypothetical protein